jgi:hypothetical protein
MEAMVAKGEALSRLRYGRIKNREKVNIHWSFARTTRRAKQTSNISPTIGRRFTPG